MSNTDHILIAINMIHHGGEFVSYLGRALSQDTEKIKQAWPELWDEYLHLDLRHSLIKLKINNDRGINMSVSNEQENKLEGKKICPECGAVQFTCQRCGHEWRPAPYHKTQEWTPSICPNCKSPYWATPRRTPKRDTAGSAPPEEVG